MGEYAHYAMRDEILGRHGFDIGDYDDSSRKPRTEVKRVKCPLCNSRPKEHGLQDHMRDKHGIKEPK